MDAARGDDADDRLVAALVERDARVKTAQAESLGISVFLEEPLALPGPDQRLHGELAQAQSFSPRADASPAMHGLPAPKQPSAADSLEGSSELECVREAAPVSSAARLPGGDDLPKPSASSSEKGGHATAGGTSSKSRQSQPSAASSSVVRAGLARAHFLQVNLLARFHCVWHILRTKWRYHRIGGCCDYRETRLSGQMRGDQGVGDALLDLFESRLQLSRSWQKEHLLIDPNSHQLLHKIGFLGTDSTSETLCFINEVSVYLLADSSPLCTEFQRLGFPDGRSFITTRLASNGDQIVTRWQWVASAEHTEGRGERCARSLRTRAQWSESFGALDFLEADPHAAEAAALRRRVPPVSSSAVLSQRARGITGVDAIAAFMEGQDLNFEIARKMAQSIGTPNYSCEDYFCDLTAAFPELQLFNACSEVDGFSSSGWPLVDEYQRTMGALFATFWLLRLNLDGKESFCYGLDSCWRPLSSEQCSSHAREEVRRREVFLHNFPWSTTQLLLEQGGLLAKDSDGRLVPAPMRVLVLLVLVILHDVLKIRMLCPTVSAQDCGGAGAGAGAFEGYQVGEVVLDEEVALNYLFTHHPDVLPSFRGLLPEQRESLILARSGLAHHLGHFAQAEAPPGPLFAGFLDSIMRFPAASREVRLCLVHWLVGFAGAEPSPLGGCEKFVVRVPLPFLVHFLECMANVEYPGASRTETEVYESYISKLWQLDPDQLPVLRPGPGAIAKMRLVVMAQGSSQRIVDAFDALSGQDRQVLSEELAYTGLSDQVFHAERAESDDKAATSQTKGPAIFISYAPAFLQNAAHDEPFLTLLILAEVFRGARSIWALRVADANKAVNVRLEPMKDLKAPEIIRARPWHSWVVRKTSSKDAVVQLASLSSLRHQSSLDCSKLLAVLCFSEAWQAHNGGSQGQRCRARRWGGGLSTGVSSRFLFLDAVDPV